MAVSTSAPISADFIGIGAQKCASTWLHQVLSAHPAIHHSQPKELDFFSYFYGKGLDWYERHFDSATPSQLKGDTSPSYFVHPLAPERAARYNPRLRILLALRDPIERAYSNHLHMVREGFLTGPDLSFERGMERNEMYLEQSRYARHLRRWLSAFPREQVFVLFQEDIAAGSERLARDCYRFLGVDAAFVPISTHRRANESRVSRRPGLDGLLRRLGQGARQLGLDPVVARVRDQAWVSALRRRSQIDLREVVPPMRADTRARLIEVLAPDIEPLPGLLGVSRLPWPAFDHVVRPEAVV